MKESWTDFRLRVANLDLEDEVAEFVDHLLEVLQEERSAAERILATLSKRLAEREPLP